MYLNLSVAHGNDVRLGRAAALQRALVAQFIVIWVGVGGI